MAEHLIHKHSNELVGGGAKLPDPQVIEYGEIAVNYAAGAETLSIRNSTDEIVEFRADGYYRKLIEDMGIGDMSQYQLKTDNSLLTDSKTIVGAINEIYRELHSETVNVTLTNLTTANTLSENIVRALRGRGLSSDSPERMRIAAKRRHEVLEMSRNLVAKAVHYGCGTFAAEELVMPPKDDGKGRKRNRLINNQWCRTLLMNNLGKRCGLAGITMIRVAPQYSSFVGNVVFRTLRLPDMVAASVEIGRRAFEFRRQYIDKTEDIRKNIVFPVREDFGALLAQSLEELGVEDGPDGLKELYDFLKERGFRYRLSLDEVPRPMFSSAFSRRALLLKYEQ